MSPHFLIFALFLSPYPPSWFFSVLAILVMSALSYSFPYRIEPYNVITSVFAFLPPAQSRAFFPHTQLPFFPLDPDHLDIKLLRDFEFSLLHLILSLEPYFLSVPS